MPSPAAEPLGQSDVRVAYDTVASTYAAMLPDTRAESPLDLAMVDAFITAVRGGSHDGADLPGEGASVLDAGCGSGRMSRYLADRGCAVQGIDLSPGMVAEARRAQPDLPFAVASLTALPFDDHTFAGVLLWYSTIHTAPAGQPEIHAEVARVLQPGGHVLVGFQGGSGVRDVVGYARHGHDVRLQRHLFTADEVSAHLATAGLREVARMQRAAVGPERDGQSTVLARAV